MNKMLMRLFIVTITGVSLLFVGMIYSYLNTQGLVAFEQNRFSDVTVVINAKNTNSASFDAVGLSQSLLQQLEKQALSTDAWQQFYAVTLIDEKLNALKQPMLGAYSIEAGVIRFVPRFALIPGQHYRAVFSFDALLTQAPMLANLIPVNLHKQTVVAVFELPSTEFPVTEVTTVYPTADQLPENMLRFYVYFSAPMRDGDALKHIRLVDAQGKEVEDIFFDPIFELWDPSMQRLTLLFDPGRVKTGLRAHNELGRALLPDQSYSLIIGEELLDANGSSLARTYEKAFTVIEADRTPPDISQWEVTSPRANRIEPLTVDFPAPLDHALLTEFVYVKETNGEKVKGQVKLTEYETGWRFTPDEPWQAGPYELVIYTRLEDLAGNNLHGLFDISPEEKLTLVDREEITLAFQVD